MSKSLTELDDLNLYFHKVLKNNFPILYKEFRLAIYSRSLFDDENSWKMEYGEEIENGKTITEWKKKCLFFDSRSEETTDEKYLCWKIFAFDKVPLLYLLKEFLTFFLDELIDGFIDCKMIEEFSDNKIVLKHLFSNVENPDIFLPRFIDKLLKDYQLPSKEVFTQLSAQMYEKRPIHGSICFLSKEKYTTFCQNLDNTVFLNLENIEQEQRVIKMSNMRVLRKLLEINAHETCMIAILEPEVMIAGIAVKDQLSLKENDVQLVFNGYLKWNFILGKDMDICISCDNGTYCLKLEIEEQKQYEQDLESLHLENKRKILKIIELLKEEEHGTSIVFMQREMITTEIQRLKGMNRYIKLSRTNSNQEEGLDLIPYLQNIKGITAIDGALLADLDGNIYAIGVIFDGEAVKPGKVSRGARYNSVQNYLYVKKKEKKDICVFGVIVSEDKSVNIVIPE